MDPKGKAAESTAWALSSPVCPLRAPGLWTAENDQGHLPEMSSTSTLLTQ